MSLLYHAYVYLEFLILACTIYILAPIEELDTEVSVGELMDTVEYDYPQFHLSMDCFWCQIVRGNLVLKEHEAARWLTKDELNNVEWLPADITLIEKIRNLLSMTR